MNTGGHVTLLLKRLETGDSRAAAQLIPLIYDELRRLAAYYLRQERPGHTLQPTALVHEAFLKLAGVDVTWQDRAHFLAAAAQAMRRILVDHARAQKAEKRGGAAQKLELDDAVLFAPERGDEVLALDIALERLAALDQRQSRVVELRYFAGMAEEEIAEALGVSVRTVKRDWTTARAWLYGEITGKRGDDAAVVGAG